MLRKLALLPVCPLVLGLLISAACGQSASLRSPDERYEATLVGDLHYRVKDVQSGKVLLTTHAQYPTANDVKTGAFSADSKRFCATYHYGHRGGYSWIGSWEIETGKRVGDEEKSGWTRTISCK